MNTEKGVEDKEDEYVCLLNKVNCLTQRNICQLNKEKCRENCLYNFDIIIFNNLK